jgi:hypothetical protein
MKTPSRRNLAARAGGWSARHWKRATFGWLLFAVAAALELGRAQAALRGGPGVGGGGPGGAHPRRAGFELPATESVLIQSRTMKTDDPAFVSAIGGVAQMVSLLSRSRRGQVGDPARRDGGWGGLLALLPATRARGAGTGGAARLGARVSGGDLRRAVLISGGTVLIAMAGMFFAGNDVFTSIALGTMMVVFVAMIGSLSVLPALLHRLGDKVEKGRIPFLGRMRRPAGDSRFLGANFKPVLRHPAAG